MKRLRAYKTELDPNNKQKTLFVQCCGAARFVYNWALADRKRAFEAGEKTNYFEQIKRFNALKSEQFPWLYTLPYTVEQEAFKNLDTAYQNFFRRIKQGLEKPGFPKFKSRAKGLGAFSLRGSIHIETDRIKLLRIGWVRFKQKDYLPLDGTVKLLKVTISERARRWFISAQVEEEVEEPQLSTNPPIGVDVGIKSLAVCSDGRTFDNPKALYKYERKIVRLSRELSRRTKGSKNREKTKRKLAKAHFKVASIRNHHLQRVSRYVTAIAKPSVIAIEDLNVKGMMKNHKLAKSIGDSSMSELHRQIKYKADWNGCEVFEAHRFYASSKTCSNCGAKKEDLTLDDRVYNCDQCGLIIDRDLNAAINLVHLVEPPNGRGLPGELDGLPSTVNQEAGSSNA